MLQILFQYTQWKVALTVTIQRVSENQHRSGILSSDYSFGDEEMWTSASLVVIRSECWNRLEYLRSQTLFLASLRFACLRSNCPDQNTTVSCHLLLERCNPGTKCGVTFN